MVDGILEGGVLVWTKEHRYTLKLEIKVIVPTTRGPLYSVHHVILSTNPTSEIGGFGGL